MSNIIYKNYKIEYIIQRKKVKNINIKIKSDNIVYVSANKNTSVKYIEGILIDKWDFILKAIAKQKAKKTICPSPEKIYNNDMFELWGNEKVIKIIKSTKNEEKVVEEEKFLTFYVKTVENSNRIKTLLNIFLENELLKYINNEAFKILDYDIFKYRDMPNFKLRKMTSCWGICRPLKNQITINKALICLPKPLLDYVLLHEFVHFIEPNHSENFYGLVAAYMPDYLQRKAQLNLININFQ